MRLAPIAILAAALAYPLAGAEPTVQEAQKFMDQVETKLLALSTMSGRADWVRSTFITGDTELLAADANERAISATVAFAKQATRFDKLALPAELARKIKLLKLSLTLATPADPKESRELTEITARMEGVYGKGEYCAGGDQAKCLDLEEITRIMATSRDAAQLLDVWRSKYDMAPDDFAKEVDRLWEQVRPLYVSLHAYVRNKLREKYGDAVVPARGPIPAHLLGNMWAQTWDNVYPLAAPQDADPGFDLTQILKSRKTDWRQTVLYGEGFFTSLGFARLSQSVEDFSGNPAKMGERDDNSSETACGHLAVGRGPLPDGRGLHSARPRLRASGVESPPELSPDGNS